MEYTIAAGSTQWVQSYDYFHSPLPFSEATAVTTGVDTSLLSPNKSRRAIDNHQHQLSPKSNGCVSKPIRRRSRASKRTPTTLLNANTTNFRDLVQQFTGCPRASISFANQKGPITLNFGAGSAHNYSSNCSTNFLDKFHHRQRSQQENWRQQNVQLQQQQKQLYQQQEQEQPYYGMEQIVLDNVSNDASNSTTSPNLEVEDDFVLDNFSLDELTMEYLFSNG